LASHRGYEAQAVMALNPRYIFFRLDPDDDGHPAGAAGVPLTERRAIAVDPAQRGRGLALGLLAHLALLARRQGLTRLRLEVRPENTAALQLYLAQGFRPIGLSLGYYQDSGACLHLERQLEGSHAHAPDHRQ